MPHKETKTPTLFGVTPDKEIFENLKSEITKNGRSIDYLDIPYLFEAYRIERNKQEAPNGSIIKQATDEYYLLEYANIQETSNFEAGIKWAINHFTNLNK